MTYPTYKTYTVTPIYLPACNTNVKSPPGGVSASFPEVSRPPSATYRHVSVVSPFSILYTASPSTRGASASATNPIV